MNDSGLKPTLEKLGLRQTEFAQLLNVSARTVNMWANGVQPLPGAVAGYLRLLTAADPSVREAELERLQGRTGKGRPLRDGIYGIAYRAEGEAHQCRGMAVLRRGKLSGADADGNMFSGDYVFDRARGTNTVHLTLELGAQSVEGVMPLSDDTVEMDFCIGGGALVVQANALIAGEPFEIELRFLGPLPE